MIFLEILSQRGGAILCGEYNLGARDLSVKERNSLCRTRLYRPNSLKNN